MTAVFLIRHPQTTWNEAQRYQGRLESPLSDEGCRQADSLCRAFVSRKLDAVYSSPLGRALHFGQELARLTDAHLHVDQRLTEVAQCPWEGLRLPEIQVRYLDLYQQWYSNPDIVEFPGGESVHDVQRRALSVLNGIFRTRPEGDVAVVSHSVVIQTIVSAALGLALKHLHRIRLANAGVTILCGRQSPGSVWSLNDTTPLYGSPLGSAEALGCAKWKEHRRATQ